MRNDSLHMQAVGSEEHSSIGLVGRFNWKLIDSEIVGCQYRPQDGDVVAITAALLLHSYLNPLDKTWG